MRALHMNEMMFGYIYFYIFLINKKNDNNIVMENEMLEIND